MHWEWRSLPGMAIAVWELAHMPAAECRDWMTFAGRESWFRPFHGVLKDAAETDAECTAILDRCPASLQRIMWS
jgi:hypothetical protein